MILYTIVCRGKQWRERVCYKCTVGKTDLGGAGTTRTQSLLSSALAMVSELASKRQARSRYTIIMIYSASSYTVNRQAVLFTGGRRVR